MLGRSRFPSSSEWSGGRGATALPCVPGFCLSPSTTVTRNACPYLGFGPVAGARCHPPLCVSFSLLHGSFQSVPRTKSSLLVPQWKTRLVYHKPPFEATRAGDFLEFCWEWADRPQGFHFPVGGPRPPGVLRPPGWWQGRLARKAIGLREAVGRQEVAPANLFLARSATQAQFWGSWMSCLSWQQALERDVAKCLPSQW